MPTTPAAPRRKFGPNFLLGAAGVVLDGQSNKLFLPGVFRAPTEDTWKEEFVRGCGKKCGRLTDREDQQLRATTLHLGAAKLLKVHDGDLMREFKGHGAVEVMVLLWRLKFDRALERVVEPSKPRPTTPPKQDVAVTPSTTPEPRPINQPQKQKTVGPNCTGAVQRDFIRGRSRGTPGDYHLAA